jgi:hypothetical protein
MAKSRLIHAVITMACLASSLSMPAAQAQQQSQSGGCNLAGVPALGLRTPLVNGASMGLPFVSAPHGAPPAIGDGMCPAPVNPGMQGPPTLLPENARGGTNHIGGSTYYLPYNAATQSMPGQLGPSLLGVPAPPSTPGCDPGQFGGPRDFYRPPVSETYVNPGGGISACAPTQRWGGQTSRDFGKYKHRGTRSYDWGQQAVWGQNSMDGPFQQLPGAMATQDLYGRRGYTDNGCTTQTYAPY